MTREEQIKQKAHEISQMCFPDSQNIWARPNIEAQLVHSACYEMVRWADENPKEGLVSIDKVCKLLSQYISPEDIYDGETDEIPNTYLTVNIYDNMVDFIKAFRKAMEE